MARHPEGLARTSPRLVASLGRTGTAAVLVFGLAMPTAAYTQPAPTAREKATAAEPAKPAPKAAELEAAESEAVSPPESATPVGAKPSLLDQIDEDSTSKPAWDAPAAPPAPTFPYFEYHGYFRLRPDLINNGHLGIAAPNADQTNVVTTSAIQPPLSKWPQNNDKALNPAADHVGSSRDDSAITGANMRFRIEPTLHLSESIHIRTTMDIFDNYVLGGNPDYAGALKRPDVPLSAFATSSLPGNVAIKEAYGEWKTMLGLLRMGRQASQWGLGMLTGGGSGTGWDGSRPTEYYGGARMPWEGSGYDSDVGTYVDRIAFLTKVFGVYTTVFYDFASKGFLGVDPTRFDGQVRDMGSADDVNQFGLAFLSKPLSADDVTARKKLLLDDMKPAFDWGAYLLYRKQDLDLQGTKPASQLTLGDARTVKLMERNAWAGIGDLWARYEQRMAFSRRLVIEAEFATIYGHVDDVGTVASTTTSEVRARDLRMWGASLKSAYQNEGIGIYLDVGAASGDDTRCFGVYGSGDCSISTATGAANETISGFKFHRDFRVDSLLFREVVGAVTNAVYVKPTFSINAYPFYAQQQLGADLAVLYARAMNAEGTPGNAANLGTELMARGFFGQKGLFLGQISFSYLFPGAAFTLQKDYNKPSLVDVDHIDASSAWRLLGHVVLMF